MRPEDVEKLLAGYAAGTLDEAERRVLMRAALERQELFDALVEEDALKELLEDPRCRRQLLELLGAPRRPLWERAWDWMRRPARLAALASATAAVVLVSAFVLQTVRREPIPAVAPVPATTPGPAAPGPSLATSEGPGSAAVPVGPSGKAERPGAVRAKRRSSVAGPAPADVHAQAAPAATPEATEAARAEQRAAAVQEKAVQEKVVREKPEAPAFGAALRAADAGGDASRPAGLRVRLLRNGVEVAPGEELGTRDEVVLRVEAAQGGRLWVYRRTGEGVLQILPLAGIEGRPVTSGSPLEIRLPAPEQEGEENLVLVLTPEAGEAASPLALRQRERAAVASGSPAPVRPLAVVPLTLRYR